VLPAAPYRPSPGRACALGIAGSPKPFFALSMPSPFRPQIALTCVYHSPSWQIVWGLSRESVNKCLQEWRGAGSIRIDKRVITIVDRAALEALVEPE
jgi:hypothetical protein